MKFWDSLDELVKSQKIVIERPKGSSHPTYHDAVYPVDYGYLNNTTGSDGNEVDVWIGSSKDMGIVGIICTADLKKRDAELKILLDCTEDEMKQIESFHNVGMAGLLLKR